MFAIINISGKQFRTNKGTHLKVPKQKNNVGSKIKFEDILFISDGEKTHIGKPNVKGASVTATILNHARYKKILIYKKKRRKGYQRKNGHKQWYTEIQIDDIKLAPTKNTTSKAKPKKSKTNKTASKAKPKKTKNIKE